VYGPGWVRLSDACLGGRRLRPGESLSAALTWHTGDTQPADGLVLFAQLVSADGWVLDQQDLIPQAGRYPASVWLPGRRFVETVRLTVPADAAAGPMRLLVGWYVAGRPAERVPVQAGRGATTGCAAPAAGRVVDGNAFGWPLVVAPAPGRAGPPHVPRADQLAGPRGLRLLGFTTVPQHGLAGPGLSVRLTWVALAAGRADLSTFVHLLDRRGRLVATADGPAGGAYGTSLWQSGEPVQDLHTLDLAGLPADRYRLTVGLYRLATGERLTARDAGGRPWPANEITLGELTVGGSGPRFQALRQDGPRPAQAAEAGATGQ
jgi:hypothetical protein